MRTKANALKAAFPHTLPILTGFGFLGIAFGILMQINGYGIGWAFLMSAICYCGSMQYAAVPMLTSFFDPVQAFILTITINARHIFYGISTITRYKGTGRLKFFLIYMLCDETYSIVSSAEIPANVEPRWFYFFISVLDYSYWVVFTVVGAAAARFIPSGLTGLDFVLTALFVVIFLNQIDNKPNLAPAFIGVICTLICRIIFGTTYFLIPAMIIIIAILIGSYFITGSKDKEADNNAL